MIAHGICYDFFFFTGQLYVDKHAPNEIRSSAQGFIAFVTLGVGMFIGANVNGWWNGKQTTGTGPDAVVNWPAVWYFPSHHGRRCPSSLLLSIQGSKQR